MKRASREPVSLSIPTDASYKPSAPNPFRSPHSSHVSTPIRQLHSYALTPRSRSTHGPVTDRYSNHSSQATPRPKTSRAPEPAIVITEEVKTVVKEWISALGFGKMTLQPREHYLKDQFRNGVLACELAQVLEKKGLEGVNRSPGTSVSVEKNFSKALGLIAKGKPQSFPSGFFSLSPKLARGHLQLIWGLYWSLYNAYPSTLPAYLEDVSKELPYDSLAIRRLEAALMAWLHSFGVTQDYGFPDSLIDLIPAFRSGVMLCQVVSMALGTALDGVFLYPISEGGVLSNMRKALDVLKRVPNMSQKFVWGREKELMKGNLGVIMGLLEDICRCGDGLPARKPGHKYHFDGPYCGLYDPKRTSTQLKSSLKSRSSEEIAGKTAAWKPNGAVSSTTTVSPNHLFTLGAELNDLFPGLKSDFPNDIVPTPSRRTTIPESTRQVPAPFSAFHCQIHKWLLSLGLSQYQNYSFDGPLLPSLTNGLLLCDLIEALDRTKLVGVSNSPKTTANCRGNLRRALDFLRKKPTFPPELHYIEEKLLVGEGKSWRKVLLELHRIYRYAGVSGKRR